jgi:hypothetical protein
MNITLDITQIEKYTKEDLITLIQYLINNDIEKLIYVLYRVDVSEDIIKKLLHTTSKENTEVLIADAIIKRIEEKILWKQKFKSSFNHSEEEKW